MKLEFVLVYFNVWNVFQVIYAPASMCFSFFVSLFLSFHFFPSLKQEKKTYLGVNWFSRLGSQTL